MLGKENGEDLEEGTTRSKLNFQLNTGKIQKFERTMEHENVERRGKTI